MLLQGARPTACPAKSNTPQAGLLTHAGIFWSPAGNGPEIIKQRARAAWREPCPECKYGLGCGERMDNWPEVPSRTEGTGQNQLWATIPGIPEDQKLHSNMALKSKTTLVITALSNNS